MSPIKHVAIIMDGNGRWGLKKRKSRNFGHRAGLLTVEKILEVTIKKKIKYLTLFAFSTENWKRPKKEIIFLFNLLEEFLINKIDNLKKNNIKLKIIGNKKVFPKKLIKILDKSENMTRMNKKLQINLALNYGSKDELINAFKKIHKKKLLINKKNIDKNLYTSDCPNPDILIRTGDTKRLSNFLLWQIAYAEIFFVNKLWPDFTKNNYTLILNKFLKIKRNFGSI